MSFSSEGNWEKRKCVFLVLSLKGEGTPTPNGIPDREINKAVGFQNYENNVFRTSNVTCLRGLHFLPKETGKAV